MLRWVAVMLLCWLASAPALANSWETAVNALEEGRYEKAAALFQRLAPEGDQRAQYVIAVLYLEGRGVERDPERAARWIQRSAKNGFIPSQALLGRLYLLGQGVERDEAEAVRWYRMAADQGDPNAQGSLGVLYERGVAGIPANPHLSARWFALAARNGSTSAAKHFERVSAKLSAEERQGIDTYTKEWKPRLAKRSNGPSTDELARKLGDDLGLDSVDIGNTLPLHLERLGTGEVFP